MRNFKYYLNIHLDNRRKDVSVIGQHDYDLCWRATVENVLDNIIDEIKKLKDKYNKQSYHTVQNYNSKRTL